VLLTRSPLIPARRRFTVRLACVKHAASVRPEPGSNSPLMSYGNRTVHRTVRAADTRSTPRGTRSDDLARADVTSFLVVCHTKGIRQGCTSGGWPAPPRRRGLFGIDFWHAVEFSRSGRAPKPAFRPSAGQPFYPASVFLGCQTRCPAAPPRAGTHGQRTAAVPSWGGRPPDRPPTVGVRCVLPGDPGTVRSPATARQIIRAVRLAQGDAAPSPRRA
jgi:hypothetical protein